MKNPITKKQRRPLDTAIREHVRHLQSCRRQLRYVDQEILAAGMELFESEAVLANWLCQPALSLGAQVPLRVARTAKGRAMVATALRRIFHSCP